MPSGPVVVLTRESEDNVELAKALLKKGVLVREIPCVSTRLVIPKRLPEARLDVVAFSSRRGVWGVVRQRLTEKLIPVDGRPLVAAVGRATAEELESSGVWVDLVADPPEGAELARMIMEQIEPPAAVGVVRGDLRAGGMDEALEQAGYWVEPVVVYENVGPNVPRLQPTPVAAVFVASPSAAERLLEKNSWLKAAHFCAIGPVTAAALEKLGVVSVEEVGTQFDGQLEALCRAHSRALGADRS